MKLTSPILKAFTQPIFIFINILAFYLLLKGHNEPGGGFIAGVATAISFIYISLILGKQALNRFIKIDPIYFSIIGLLIAYATAFFPMIYNKPFLYHKMIHFHAPFLGDIHIGSPVLFDIGVYLVVVGVTTKMIHVFLNEVEQEASEKESV